jgi:hypothetical protein
MWRRTILDLRTAGELMTERKPQGMSFASWIDQQVSDAEKRGLFDNLPGLGKPLPLPRESGTDYGQAWVRDYARREGVPTEDLLPTPLRLRKEIERLAEMVQDMGSEDEVRETVADLNRRIVEWRRIPVGPPVFVRLVDKEEMVSRWRQRQAAKSAPAAPAGADSPAGGAPAAGDPGTAEMRPSRGHRRWRGIGRRRPRSG